jgi:hypothetical protein
VNAPSASLRSENDEMKSAVEMPPRGKRGKLKKRVSHSFHRAWKSGKRRPDFHISTAPATGFIHKEGEKKMQWKPNSS